MRINIPKSKRAQAIITIAIAAILVLSGTFAWYSFNQNRINTFVLSRPPDMYTFLDEVQNRLPLYRISGRSPK